jgi:pyridoxine 4-dehydrogenase
VPELERARKVVDVVSVQNRYNLTDREWEPTLEYCEQNGIAFIPWFPLATGALAGEGSPLAKLAAEQGATPSQLALAWLLRRSPVMLPIPGTSTVSHLEDNIAAASVELTDEQFAELSDVDTAA